MPAPTPNRGYVYATRGDDNDVPLVSQRLADALDADVQALYNHIPAAHLSSSRSQNIPASAWTELTMGDPTGNDWTRGGMVKNDAGNRLIVPTTGIYLIVCAAIWPAGARRRGITATVNGVAVNGIMSDIRPGTADGLNNTFVSMIWPLSAGAEVGVSVFQDTTAQIAVNSSRLQMARIGA